MKSQIPFWHPAEYARRLPLLKMRAKIIETIRGFFVRRDFLEVETPILQISPGLEPHLKAFQPSLVEPFGQADRTMYLHTSPEFTMKKLLAVGGGPLGKIHFHTNEPWKVLEYCSTLGEIYDIVVEDIERQSRGLKG